MHHRLPGRLTTVQADVEAADGGIRHLKILPPLLEECSDGIPLGLMKLHSIGHMPAVYGIREVPAAFCTPRETSEDNIWARARAEEWAAAELKRFHAKGYLNWSRRERTWYDECGLNPHQKTVTFDDRHTGAFMQISGSQQKFLLSSSGHLINRRYGLDQPI